MSVIKTTTDKKGKCYYFACYYHDTFNNLKQYHSKRYSLKKEAEQAERLFLLKNTDTIDTSIITMKDLFNQYLDFQKDKVKVTSYYNYHKMLKHLELLNNIKVVDFNISQFNKWKEKLNKTKYSTRYKNSVYSFLVACLRYGIKYKNYDLSKVLNQMTRFTNPNELKKEMDFYTYDEFIKFISVEDDLVYKCFFETLYYLGLRKEEANALTWKDIDFNNNSISINKSLTQKIKGHRYIILPPKTKSSIRVLNMPKVLSNDLFELKKYYSTFRNYEEKWFVFGSELPLGDTRIATEQLKLEKKANVHHIRIHDFRHSCASLLINNGASILLVSRYLGHSNVSTTLNTYSHLFKNEFNDIVKTIDNLDIKK